MVKGDSLETMEFWRQERYGAIIYKEPIVVFLNNSAQRSILVLDYQ